MYDIQGGNLRHRRLSQYRTLIYDIVSRTYDIVGHKENISYTISQVQKYIRCRRWFTYDIVGAYRIRYRRHMFDILYRMSGIRYRRMTYDVVLNIDIVCDVLFRMFDLRYRMSFFTVTPCYPNHPMLWAYRPGNKPPIRSGRGVLS